MFWLNSKGFSTKSALFDLCCILFERQLAAIYSIVSRQECFG